MNKQIIKMAKDLCHARDCHIKDEQTECYHGCKAWGYAERAVNKGYRKQEWISVDERLPSHLQKVLVCDSFGNMVTAIFLSFDNGGCDWCSAVRIVHEITHWMPLPETPKKYESEGADDEN